ncbi:MAG TPA: hypothetical protein VN948_02100 [Terriglobales bacterium]|nr:hypothetical protein [Terriglobales bacterium]
MAEETNTLSFTLTMPAKLADRIEQALRADHVTLDKIVTEWLLWVLVGRGRRIAPVPMHYFLTGGTKSLTVTLPAELAGKLEPALLAEHVTLERIVIGWLLARHGP